MAEAVRFKCDACGHAIEAWSDGNPYYINDAGEKEYAYHPDHERLDRCIGNDSPHLCLNCGEEFMVDSEHPIQKCPKCKESKIVDTFLLDGHLCPFCSGGTFGKDPDFFCIS